MSRKVSISQVIILFTSLLFINCASHKKVNRKLSELKCNKTVYFSFDDASERTSIEYTGAHIGNSKIPDYKESFIQSINEINQSTEMELFYKDILGFPEDDIDKVEVYIKHINWDFYTSSMIMNLDLVYRHNNKELEITGSNKVLLMGTKKGNLSKALKDGHLKFLKNICFLDN